MKLAATLLLGLTMALAANAQTEAALTPSQDATLYQDADGRLANGAGQSLFAGTTAGGERRRALLAFDVAGQLPAGAQVQQAALELSMSRTIAGPVPVSLHRVTAGWGEGASDPSGQEGRGTAAGLGDATWLHRVFDTVAWAAVGGDFDPAARATAQVDGAGRYTWGSTPAMVADVQRWLDEPPSNAGWMVVGSEGAAGTAKRFDSREGPEATRPVLRVTYTAPATAAEAEPTGGVELLPAAPNPFGGATTLAYALAAPQHVRLEVFDVLGRRRAVLVDGPRPAGPHRAVFAAGPLPDGVYVVRLLAGGEPRVGRVVLAR